MLALTRAERLEIGEGELGSARARMLDEIARALALAFPHQARRGGNQVVLRHLSNNRAWFVVELGPIDTAQTVVYLTAVHGGNVEAKLKRVLAVLIRMGFRENNRRTKIHGYHSSTSGPRGNHRQPPRPGGKETRFSGRLHSQN